MASAILFDTHAYVKKLEAVGFTEAQAEVQAQALADMVNDQLATKRDIAELQRDIEALRVELKRDIEELRVGSSRDMKELRVGFSRDMKELELRLKNDLTLRLGAMIAVAVAAIAALDKFL